MPKNKPAALEIKRKLRPRGKPFKKGNRIGPRFQPGQSGNPGGRPKCKQIGDACRAILRVTVPGKDATFAEAIALRLASLAVSGRPDLAIRAASELADRAEGRPAQALTLATPDDPLSLLLQEMKAESQRISPPETDTQKTEATQ